MRNALSLNQCTRLQVWQLVETDPHARPPSDPVDSDSENDYHLASSTSTDGCATLPESANVSTLPGCSDAAFSSHIKAVEDVLNILKCENRKVKSLAEPCYSAS